jgi:hypothetical protein
MRACKYGVVAVVALDLLASLAAVAVADHIKRPLFYSQILVALYPLRSALVALVAAQLALAALPALAHTSMATEAAVGALAAKEAEAAAATLQQQR